MDAMNRDAADELFTRIRDGLANVEALILEVIRSRAWEPLGYPTFMAAWNDRLSGIRLATAGSASPRNAEPSASTASCVVPPVGTAE